jgi:hypothetical protein
LQKEKNIFNVLKIIQWMETYHKRKAAKRSNGGKIQKCKIQISESGDTSANLATKQAHKWWIHGLEDGERNSLYWNNLKIFSWSKSSKTWVLALVSTGYYNKRHFQ